MITQVKDEPWPWIWMSNLLFTNFAGNILSIAWKKLYLGKYWTKGKLCPFAKINTMGCSAVSLV